MSFLSKLFAVTWGPSQSQGGSEWWFSGAAPKTHAGTVATEQTALTVTAVYRAIALISEAVSMLPIDVFQRVGDGDRVERSDHPAAKVLKRPNPMMTSTDLRGAAQGHTLQNGNAYLDIQRDEGGEPIGLWPLLPDRTSLVSRQDGSGGRTLVYTTSINGKIFDIDPNNVAHIHGIGYDGLRGYSPLRMARQAVGLALGLEQFGAQFFGNDATSGGFLQHPGKLSEPAKKNLADSVQAAGGIDKAHRIKVLEEGMEFKPTTISPEDSQFLSTRTFQVEEIARLYGVPLHMLQSHTKTTSFGAGIAQMSLGFLIYTINPWLIRWEQELDRKLFTEAEQDAGFFVKHNVNALLRADPKTRADFYKAALNKVEGWMTRDEVRRLEDLNPDEADRDEAIRSIVINQPPSQG